MRHCAVEAVDLPQKDLVLLHFLVDAVCGSSGCAGKDTVAVPFDAVYVVGVDFLGDEARVCYYSRLQVVIRLLVEFGKRWDCPKSDRGVHST